MPNNHPPYTIIDLQRWEPSEELGDTQASGKPKYSHVVISPFHSMEVVEDTVLNSDHAITEKVWNVESLSLYLLWHIFSCYAGEQDSIIASKDIGEYCSRALDFLDKGVDSGLLPSYGLSAWQEISAEEREKIKEKFSHISEDFEAFPPLNKLNVVSVAEPCELEFGTEDIESFVPAITETKSGIVGVVPVFSESDYPSAALLLNSKQRPGRSIHVSTIHIWNLDGKISKAKHEDAYRVEEYVASLL